jgi:mono/diheme cytochrome c family protein
MRYGSLLLLSALLLTAAALASDPSAQKTAAAVPTDSSAHKAVAAPPSDPSAKPAESATRLYEVKDGNKVDAVTLQGWKTWRAMACERCHGPAQEGLVGPALIESLKKLTKAQFLETITKGRLEKGMPPFGGVETVMKNWEGLYAYLKGRSDGQILPGRLTAIEQN